MMSYIYNNSHYLIVLFIEPVCIPLPGLCGGCWLDTALPGLTIYALAGRCCWCGCSYYCWCLSC
jgi:hypothetical protein